MVNETKNRDTFDQDKIKRTYENGKDEVENVYQHVKDSACNLYEEGKKKVEEAQAYLGDHSDELIKMVRDKPLTSLLMAMGAGYLLSAILRK